MLSLRPADLFRRLRGSLAAMIAIAAIALLFAAVAGWRVRREAMERKLLLTPIAEMDKHPELIRFAAGEAKPIFAKECAPCHGKDMKGMASTGAPNLADHVWLYGNDLFRIERTVLYGIRSGQTKANDIADMRAFGQRGLLTDDEISNVVQYVLQLSNQPHDADAAHTERRSKRAARYRVFVVHLKRI